VKKKCSLSKQNFFLLFSNYINSKRKEKSHENISQSSRQIILNANSLFFSSYPFSRNLILKLDFKIKILLLLLFTLKMAVWYGTAVFCDSKIESKKGKREDLIANQKKKLAVSVLREKKKREKLFSLHKCRTFLS